MEVRTREFYFDDDNYRLALWPLFDWHVGAKAFAEPRFKSDVAKIAADPNAVWLGGGDYMDAITRKDKKRYQEDTLADWLMGESDILGLELRYTDALVAPIKNKNIALLEGNHEKDAGKHNERNIYWDFAELVAEGDTDKARDLAVGVEALINLEFRRGTPEKYKKAWTIQVYAFHGSGGGTLPGGHALFLGRVLDNITCDLALLGHRHVLEVTPKTKITSIDGMLYQHSRLAMFVPSYLRTYIGKGKKGKAINTYPQHKGLPPTRIGAIPIYIYPAQKSFEVVIPNMGGWQKIER